MQRQALIRERLQHAFAPSYLEVIDDSDKHRGHAGAEGGAGHYTIKITAECFNGLSRIAAHQKIYQLLADMIPHDIHALSIKLKINK